MYRVQYYCPRQSPYWQEAGQQFHDLQSAAQVANGLIWRYHSARVIDPWGRAVYQV